MRKTAKFYVQPFLSFLRPALLPDFINWPAISLITVLCAPIRAIRQRRTKRMKIFPKTGRRRLFSGKASEMVRQSAASNGSYRF